MAIPASGACAGQARPGAAPPAPPQAPIPIPIPPPRPPILIQAQMHAYAAAHSCRREGGGEDERSTTNAHLEALPGRSVQAPDLLWLLAPASAFPVLL